MTSGRRHLLPSAVAECNQTVRTKKLRRMTFLRRHPLSSRCRITREFCESAPTKTVHWPTDVAALRGAQRWRLFAAKPCSRYRHALISHRPSELKYHTTLKRMHKVICCGEFGMGTATVRQCHTESFWHRDKLKILTATSVCAHEGYGTFFKI